ncbi:hypothetical protein ACFWBH_28195 [Streptomyces sp. NPDC059999]|uniref:hypothetical protein n=1 Tax=Streptomyces sp. NPDC059999 TaxID=3347030 RepID=UPI0036A9FE65
MTRARVRPLRPRASATPGRWLRAEGDQVRTASRVATHAPTAPDYLDRLTDKILAAIIA